MVSIEELVMLIKAGSNIYAVDKYDETPTDLAIKLGIELIWAKALDTCSIEIIDVMLEDSRNRLRG